MTNQEKLNYILTEIKQTPKEGVYKIKECIKDRIDFYSKDINKLENISFEKLKKHSFVSETLYISETKQKQSYKKKLLSKILKLERHLYAPEMNKIHFKNKTVRVPQQTDIYNSIDYIIRVSSINEIKNLITL
jgi:hypothetical protein